MKMVFLTLATLCLLSLGVSLFLCLTVLYLEGHYMALSCRIQSTEIDLQRYMDANTKADETQYPNAGSSGTRTK